jgi:hypothetical protein
MGMTPHQFFEGFVQGNYDDCEQHPGSIRHAFNAAVSASHLADHYFVYYGKHFPSKVSSFAKIGDFVEYLSNETGGCFRDIRSISNAYKHLYTSADPRRGAYSSISSTGAIETVTLNDADGDVQRIEEDWVEGPEGSDTEPKVVFTRKDNKRVEFLLTLKTVVEFWDKLLMTS